MIGLSENESALVFLKKLKHKNEANEINFPFSHKIGSSSSSIFLKKCEFLDFSLFLLTCRGKICNLIITAGSWSFYDEKNNGVIDETIRNKWIKNPKILFIKITLEV